MNKKAYHGTPSKARWYGRMIMKESAIARETHGKKRVVTQRRGYLGDEPKIARETYGKKPSKSLRRKVGVILGRVRHKRR